MSGASAISEIDLAFLNDDRYDALSLGKLEHPRHRLAVVQDIVKLEGYFVSRIVLTGL